MAKKRMTASEYAKKWKQGASGRQQAYTDGVNGVTDSPMAKAAEAAPRMLAGVTEAVNSGRYAANCNAVSLEEWKRKAAGKGAANYSTGVNAAEPDVIKAAGPLLSHIYSVRDEVTSMPGDTLEQRIQRAVTNIRRMAEYKKGG